MRIILWRPGFHFVSSLQLNAVQQQIPRNEPTERGKDTLKPSEEWGEIQQWIPRCRSNSYDFPLHNCHATPSAFSIYINPQTLRSKCPPPITSSTVWSLVWGNSSQPHPCPSELGGQNEQVTSHLPSTWHFPVNFTTLHLLNLELKATRTRSFPLWEHHEN